MSTRYLLGLPAPCVFNLKKPFFHCMTSPAVLQWKKKDLNSLKQALVE